MDWVRVELTAEELALLGRLLRAHRAETGRTLDALSEAEIPDASGLRLSRQLGKESEIADDLAIKLDGAAAELARVGSRAGKTGSF